MNLLYNVKDYILGVDSKIYAVTLIIIVLVLLVLSAKLIIDEYKDIKAARASKAIANRALGAIQADKIADANEVVAKNQIVITDVPALEKPKTQIKVEVSASDEVWRLNTYKLNFDANGIVYDEPLKTLLEANWKPFAVADGIMYFRLPITNTIKEI